MKLTKDTLIEGRVVKRGTRIKIKEANISKDSSSRAEL
jgi:hypothetical protein